MRSAKRASLLTSPIMGTLPVSIARAMQRQTDYSRKLREA